MLKRRDFVQGAGLAAVASLLPAVGVCGTAADMGLAMPPDSDFLERLRYKDRDHRARPPEPFNSNHNYWLYGGGDPIRKLRVTIRVARDIVAPTGMSFQLNASSPASYDTETPGCVFQQYVTGFNAKTSALAIYGTVENFPSKTYRWQLHKSIGFPCGTVPHPDQATCKGNLFNEHYGPRAPFSNFPGVAKDRVPAGYKIIYDLINGSGGRIVGAKFTIVDADGNRTVSGPNLIDTFEFSHTDTVIGSAYPTAMAPILAFQMDIVGNGGGVYTELQSGAGTITYEAETALTPEGSMKEFPAVFPGGTGETSNIQYAELGAGPQHKIVQWFGTPPSGVSAGTGATSGSTRKTYDQAPPQQIPKTPPIPK